MQDSHRIGYQWWNGQLQIICVQYWTVVLRCQASRISGLLVPGIKEFYCICKYSLWMFYFHFN